MIPTSEAKYRLSSPAVRPCLRLDQAITQRGMQSTENKQYEQGKTRFEIEIKRTQATEQNGHIGLVTAIFGHCHLIALHKTYFTVALPLLTLLYHSILNSVFRCLSRLTVSHLSDIDLDFADS